MRAEPHPAVQKVSLDDAEHNLRHGGDIRMLLSPKIASVMQALMGVVILQPGEFVCDHYHPFSEESLYVVDGVTELDVEGKVLTLGAREGVLIPRNLRHRLVNKGTETAQVVFHISPLAPRPDLGSVHLEAPPRPDEPELDVGSHDG